MLVRLFLLLMRVAIPLLLVYGLWRVFSPKWTFKVVANEDGVQSHEGITTPQQRRLLNLLKRIRFVEGQVTICGMSDRDGRLRLKFYGKISEEAQQQIRNFIVNEL